MDFSEAENRFQRGRQHMSESHIVLALYGQLTIWCKSAYYLALQSPKAHVKIKNCLHEALKVIEELQRMEARTPSEKQEDLNQCQQDLESLFSSSDHLISTDLLHKVHKKSIELKNRRSKTTKRRHYSKSPLNVNRKNPSIE